MDNVKIIIATHKPYPMPTEDIYLPLHVGAFGKESIGYVRDDTGDNISKKNDMYSELTGLYWAWKNLDAESIGLCHYRRRFVLKNMSFKDFKDKIFVPKKRKYYIESLYSHYAHTLEASHLDIAKDIITRDYPEYLPALVNVYSRTWGYMWNMTIMPNKELDAYCSWLFSILFEMEKRIDTDSLDDFSKRLFGRVSEILFNVWLTKRGANPKELKVYSTEPVNWVKKIRAFLFAKFLGKRYKESF